MNDLVDRLAVEAADTQGGRAGDEPPTDLGPADSVRKKTTKSPTSAASVDKGIAGHALTVFGHKPTELGGYDENPTARSVRNKLVEIFEAKAQIHDDLIVVTGLRLGAEMLAGGAARDAGIAYAVVLPYPDSQKMWPKDTQARFESLVADAQEVITLQQRLPDSKAKIGTAMRRRDAWLARNATEAVVVWDGKDDLLGKLVRSLEDHLGEDVWIVDPNELGAR
jgi:uncharacterized phage-like protein YoqJ